MRQNGALILVSGTKKKKNRRTMIEEQRAMTRKAGQAIALGSRTRRREVNDNYDITTLGKLKNGMLFVDIGIIAVFKTEKYSFQGRTEILSVYICGMEYQNHFMNIVPAKLLPDRILISL